MGLENIMRAGVDMRPMDKARSTTVNFLSGLVPNTCIFET